MQGNFPTCTGNQLWQAVVVLTAAVIFLWLVPILSTKRSPGFGRSFFIVVPVECWLSLAASALLGYLGSLAWLIVLFLIPVIDMHSGP
jgi:hypothetical protein